MFKIITFEKKHYPESIPNDSRISPEPFRRNFHIIFTFRDPKIVDFQLKLRKKFKSKPEQCQVLEQEALLEAPIYVKAILTAVQDKRA